MCSQILGVRLPPVCTYAPAKFHCSRLVALAICAHQSHLDDDHLIKKFLDQVLTNVKVAFLNSKFKRVGSLVVLPPSQIISHSKNLGELKFDQIYMIR